MQVIHSFPLVTYFSRDCVKLLLSLKEDLIVKILEISKEGIAKSKIFESLTYLSKSQINRTLAYIVDNRMLQFTEINLQYVTTDKGLSYLEDRYNQKL